MLLAWSAITLRLERSAGLGGDSTSPKEKFWTSTTFDADPQNAWYIGFDDGLVKDIVKSAALRVRCVR